MKVVVIDGYPLNPGDLSWKAFEEEFDLEVYDRTEPHLVAERCAGAGIVLTNKVAFDRELISRLPELKLINVTATGYNIIDIEAAKERGVMVCNVPDYSTDSVAQHTFALILELANQVGRHSESARSGGWQHSDDFAYALTPLIELSGKTIGLVGFGNIGQRTARIASAFGMKVLYHSRTKKETDLAEYRDLESLFGESDIVSLHLPATPANAGFVNAALLRKMKRSSFFINTARGQLVNEADLAAALNEGVIAGAGVDVFSVEPPRQGNPLLSAKNCIVTPHNAWMSREARERIMQITLDNLLGFRDARPVNLVNG